MEKGIITKNVSNLYVVNTPLGEYSCSPRGLFRHKKIIPLVGDNVEIDIENKYITDIFPRKSELERPSVANIEYAIIVTSLKEPNFSSYLLDKLIARFVLKNIKPILIFTKLDKANKNELKEYKIIRKYYKKIGYPVFCNRMLFRIKRLLKGKIAFVVGQTGAGKSTLLNKLNKNLKLKTDEISKALGRGKHTTRHTELYKIGNFYIADTPGFSALELKDVKKEDLKYSFEEFKEYPCKFKDCNHIKGECNIKDNNNILKSRYESYKKIYEEIK